MLHKGIFGKNIIDNNEHQTCSQCYTSLDSDLFSHTGCYVGLDGVPIIFDSRCTISVIPHKQDFVGNIRPMYKSITGLSFNTTVKGAGKVKW